jgi:hypothetical protein
MYSSPWKEQNPGEAKNVPASEIAVAPQRPPEQDVIHQLGDYP